MANFLTSFQFDLPTRIVYGPGCITSLPDRLKEYGAKHPLLVTDKGVTKAGIPSIIMDLLSGAGITYTLFDDVEANPKDYNVEAGARVARQAGTDSIIAVGGGSPIDCAKSIGVLLAHNAYRIKLYEGKISATKPLPLLITIPTTSGTGSELTFSSVISDSTNKYKMTVKSQYTAARLAICDPELTLSVPPMVTASTGVDALTHAIEAYTATCSESISDAVALYAIELIYGSLSMAVHHGDDLEARSRMLMGSMLAGIAFSHSDVASVHCVAESLGGAYDLPHGMCNAIFLPYVMAYNAPYCQERYARVARAMGLNYSTIQEGCDAAVKAVHDLTVDVGLPSFDMLGVSRDDFSALAEKSVRNISNKSNPRSMEYNDYMNILNNAYDRKFGV